MLWPVVLATAAAHRAEQAVNSESQLTFSLHYYLYSLFMCTAPPLLKIRHFAHVSLQTASCSLLSVSLLTHKHAAFRSQGWSISLSLCSTWCLIPSLSWVGNTGSMKSLPRSMCSPLSTSIWTSCLCSCSCCSSSASVADTEPGRPPKGTPAHKIKSSSTSYPSRM